MGLYTIKVAMWSLPMMVLSGCGLWHTSEVELITPPRPLIGPNQKSQAHAYVGNRGVAPVMKLTWKGQDGNEWNAEAVVAECIQYLKKQNVWDEWKPNVPVTLAVFPDFEATERAKYIVALDPLVVIGPTRRKVERLPDSYVSIGPADLEKPNSGGRAFLPYYFFAGTTVPWNEDLQWFSPDMEVGPQPLREMQVGSDRYRIPVPWGTILLIRKGDQLIASAEGDDG